MKGTRRIKRQPFTITGANQILRSRDPNHAIWYGTLAEDLILTLFLFDGRTRPSPKAVHEKPLAIPYITEKGEPASYTPDFLVERVAPHPHLLCEVEMRAKLAIDQENWKRKFFAARQFAATKGWIFRIYTDALARHALAKNAGLLLPCRFTSPPRETVEAVLEVLALNGPIRIRDFLNLAPTLEARSDWIKAFYHLAANFQVDVDLRREISMSSFVAIPTAPIARKDAGEPGLSPEEEDR